MSSRKSNPNLNFNLEPLLLSEFSHIINDKQFNHGAPGSCSRRLHKAFESPFLANSIREFCTRRDCSEQMVRSTISKIINTRFSGDNLPSNQANMLTERMRHLDSFGQTRSRDKENFDDEEETSEQLQVSLQGASSKPLLPPGLQEDDGDDDLHHSDGDLEPGEIRLAEITGSNAGSSLWIKPASLQLASFDGTGDKITQCDFAQGKDFITLSTLADNSTPTLKAKAVKSKVSNDEVQKAAVPSRKKQELEENLSRRKAYRRRRKLSNRIKQQKQQAKLEYDKQAAKLTTANTLQQVHHEQLLPSKGPVEQKHAIQNQAGKHIPNQDQVRQNQPGPSQPKQNQTGENQPQLVQPKQTQPKQTLPKQEDPNHGQFKPSPAPFVINISVPPKRPGSVFDPPKSRGHGIAPPSQETTFSSTVSQSSQTRQSHNYPIGPPPPPPLLVPSTAAMGYVSGSSVSSSSRTVTALNPTAPPYPYQDASISGVVAEKLMTQLPTCPISQLCLPYPNQLEIFTETQRILEHVCFDFVRNHMPRKILEPQFSHAEKAELPMWIRLIRQEGSFIPYHAFDPTAYGNDLPVWEWFHQRSDYLCKLRHAAVHRWNTPSVQIESYLQLSIQFAGLLKDTERSNQLQKVLNQLQEATKQIEMKGMTRRTRLHAELEDIERRRRSLNDLEILAFNTALEDTKLVAENVKVDLRWLKEKREVKKCASLGESDVSMDTTVTDDEDRGRILYSGQVVP
ncbi:hypothetical protein TWF694_003417 [Orbilia ellipsospora]|uniref:BZIP domain-containing protein n=1 Tax=Orbilia ellipsospora TaxID=2528407 RepID=A0AAV9WZD3_9PEZI